MKKVIFVKNVEKLIYILQVIGGVTGQNVYKEDSEYLNI